MSDLRTKMRQDRYLRNSARALVKVDIQNVRDDLERKSVTTRAIDRIAEGASDVYDEAVEVASDNKGALAAIVAALALWFARNPLLDMFRSDDVDEEPQEG